MTLETYPVDDLPDPTSPPGTAYEHDVSQGGTRKDASLPQLTFAEDLDQEELPWMTLEKWRKSLVLAGYVAGLVTGYSFLIVSLASSWDCSCQHWIHPLSLPRWSPLLQN